MKPYILVSVSRNAKKELYYFKIRFNVWSISPCSVETFSRAKFNMDMTRSTSLVQLWVGARKKEWSSWQGLMHGSCYDIHLYKIWPLGSDGARDALCALTPVEIAWSGSPTGIRARDKATIISKFYRKLFQVSLLTEYILLILVLCSHLSSLDLEFESELASIFECCVKYGRYGRIWSLTNSFENAEAPISLAWSRSVSSRILITKGSAGMSPVFSQEHGAKYSEIT